MTGAAFLSQDSSWRTVWIPWGTDYNERVSYIARNPLPPIEVPIPYPELNDVRVANDNSLRMLDSRQATPSGGLPKHICGMAFGGWADAESRLQSHQRRLANFPQDTDQFRLEDNYVFAWLCVLKFNLANLSLVDETTPGFLRAMVPQQIRETQDLLDGAVSFEAKLERTMGLPSPTRQVRFAIEAAVARR